jgi:hypothetical protein
MQCIPLDITAYHLSKKPSILYASMAYQYKQLYLEIKNRNQSTLFYCFRITVFI